MHDIEYVCYFFYDAIYFLHNFCRQFQLVQTFQNDVEITLPPDTNCHSDLGPTSGPAMARIGAPAGVGFWLASRCIREWWFFDPHLLQVYCCFLKAKQSIFLCPTRRQYEHKLPFITALNLSFGGTVGLVHDFVGCDLDLQSTHSCVDALFFFSISCLLF